LAVGLSSDPKTIGLLTGLAGLIAVVSDNVVAQREFLWREFALNGVEAFTLGGGCCDEFRSGAVGNGRIKPGQVSFSGVWVLPWLELPLR